MVVGPERAQVTGGIGGVLVVVFLVSYIWLFIDFLNSRLLCGFVVAAVKVLAIHFRERCACAED